MSNEFKKMSNEDLEERLSSLQEHIFETRSQLEGEYSLEGLGSWHIQKTDKDFEQDREVAQMEYILKERYASEGLDEFGREPRNFCEYPNPLPF
jgi:hypothetical protein